MTTHASPISCNIMFFLKLNNYMARSAGSLPFLDNVTVYDRNGNKLFDKKQKFGKSAYKEIHQEQTRAWSPKEKAELIGDFNFVIEKMKARNANADEIKQIEAFKIQAFKHPVCQQSNENIASIIKDSKQR